LAGGINKTADYLTAWRDAEKFPFYLPRVPNLDINVTVENPQSYIARQNYTIEIVSNLDA